MKHLWFFLAVILVLSGCSKDNASPELSGNETKTENEDPGPIKTPYDFANGCYILKSVANSSFIEATRASYQVSAKEPTTAEPFFMKPSALGEYILHDTQAFCLSPLGNQTVIRSSNISDNARWQLTDLGENIFALKAFSSGKWLAVDTSTSRLFLTDTLGPDCRFRLESAQNCKPFPEAELNVDLRDWNGRPVAPESAMARPAVGEPITGFADVHVHINHFLASGQTTFVGETFNPLGIQEALKDCSPLHGKNGSTDLLGMVQDGITSHNTDGWPKFTWWPTSYSQTHQQAYYRWIERAWLSGQRLMVQQMVSAEVLARVKNSLIKPQIEVPPQDDISICDMQIKNMYDMQDYIDAQCGGPGKGWFRICKSSREARQAISEGKMAVILAIEVDTLCGADRDYFDDFEKGRITRRELDAKLQDIRELLDKYYDLGIRTIFPIHGINNGYGGAWLYVNIVWNLGNKVMRGNFYEIEESQNPRVFHKETGIPATESQAALLRALGIDLPYVPVIAPEDAKGHSNKQGLTKLGEWLIKELIARGIVIEIDHMSDRTVNKALKMIWDARYPGVVATHGRITDLSPPEEKIYEQLDIPRMLKVLQLGGLFSAHPDWVLRGDGYCYVEYLGEMIKHSESYSRGEIPPYAVPFDKPEYQLYSKRINETDEYGRIPGYPYMVPISWYSAYDNGIDSDDLIRGMPMTTDVNGACSLPKPELIKNPIPIDYDKGIGALYEDLYNEEIIDPSRVRFYRQVTGKRAFDVNEDGMSHYGLMPDYIRLRQIQDENTTFNAFFNGTEAYLRMLERVERYKADPENYPSRNPIYWEEVNNEDWWGWEE